MINKMTNKKVKGFTLAEVLITLGIIGIVAAMTIPNMITNYKKRETAQKVKQVYAIFNQALRLSIAENGDSSAWDYTKSSYSSDIEKYILPYLKYNILNSDYSIKTTLNNRYLYWSQRNGKYQLNNGTVFGMMLDTSGQTLVISIDINGPKGPNILGTDVFVLEKSPTSNVITTRWGEDFFDNRRGESCARLIQQNDWKIPPAENYKTMNTPCWHTDK